MTDFVRNNDGTTIIVYQGKEYTIEEYAADIIRVQEKMKKKKKKKY